MYARLIAPKWLEDKGCRKVLEGQFTDDQIQKHNQEGYNVYILPNPPTETRPGVNVDGSQITKFSYCFVDFDLKSKTYQSKDEFIEAVLTSGVHPTSITDSGNGIHVYWKVTDLDAMSYLKLTRRLMRLYNTDPAVGQIFQLMRMSDTLNTKDPNNFLKCETIYEEPIDTYTCEELDKLLPALTMEDEQHCKQHYDKTYNIQRNDVKISDKIPLKFAKLITDNQEVKDIWGKPSTDRSKSDYRLAHIMFANDFTRDEACAVLVNSAKALARAPIHRISYATNIMDKIWTFEITGEVGEDNDISMSDSVADILSKSDVQAKGKPFRCHNKIDNTIRGFRLGQVMGLVAGSGVGKTAFAMNCFRWFAQKNPDYHHFFVPLEQPGDEIAERWQTMSGGDTSLNSKVHVLSNYDADGNFRHLSFDEIKAHINKWQRVTKKKVGCIVIDHIGALKKQGAKDEKQDLMTICHNMKAFAVETDTFLIMQSQSSRAKAGIGDIELDKDAAYGTLFFEAYCDYLVTLWQPLKRCHPEPGCPTVTAYKFCKIRHKKSKDVIQEDVPYFMKFDSESEILKVMTQDDITSFNYFLDKATKKRGQDQKTKLTEYKTVGTDAQQPTTYHS